MKLIIADDNEAAKLLQANKDLEMYNLPESISKEEVVPIISSKNFEVAHYFFRMGDLNNSLRSNDIDDIAKKVADILEKSVDFVSRSGKILASANVGSKKKNRFVKNQYIPGIDKVRGYSNSTVFFNPKNSSKLFPMDEIEDIEDIGNFLFPIQSENASAATLGYLMIEGAAKKDIEYLTPVMDYICRALSLTFWGFSRDEFRNISRYTALIKQILNGDVHDNAQIKRMTDEYFPIHNSPLQLITIMGKDVYNEFKQNDNVISELFPLGLSFTYNTVTSVLLPYSEDLLSTKTLSKLQDALTKYDCTAGISEPIPQMDVNFKNYFQRAHAAAITANIIDNKEKRYMFYKEAALCHMAINLTEVPHLSGIRKSLVDVNLIQMIEMDAKKGSDYFKTLQAYWHFNHDTAKICDYLHLSKSTLFYKLNKIKEFLGQDINDYENVIQLSLGISILESMGLVHRDIYPEK